MGIPGSPAIPGWGEPNVVDDIVLVLYADPEATLWSVYQVLTQKTPALKPFSSYAGKPLVVTVGRSVLDNFVL